MRITYKGDYALKAVLDLALHYKKGVVTIHDLAKHIDAPVKFLEQVLLDLKRGEFVESIRGKNGGYLLARPPAEIKLGEVMRYIDGPVEPIACLEKDYSSCDDIFRCVFRKVWQEINKATKDIIDNITFNDLAEQVMAQKETMIYQI